ncbi:MAG: hypothetical protein ACE14S_00615 [Candidatus Bathyarchaeia archaeon]
MARACLNAVLVALLLSGLILVCPARAVHASANVIGIISSDTTWTKANSPYNLAGPTAVNVGATLTIEPGVIVNLNGFYMRVNGTLVARGTAAEKVCFNGGQVTITSIANGWKEQTGSGCLLENVNLNETSISSAVSLKIANSYSNAPITASNSSMIAHSLLTNETVVGDLSTVTDNSIAGKITTGNQATITNNNINGSVHSGSATIKNNVITGIVTIMDTISTSSVISNNTLAGGGTVWEFVMFVPGLIPRNARYPRSVIDVAGGTAVISNNTITSQDIGAQVYGISMPESNYDGGYGITTQADCNANIQDNIISNGFVRGINMVGPGIIQDNLIINNTGGIAVGKKVYDYGMKVSQGDVTIRGNILANTEVGIGGFVTNNYYGSVDYENTPKERTITIERNVITGSANGIDFALPLTTLNIQNNTITNSSFAISLTSCPSATINYNNIQNYAQKSVNLTNTSVDINATYNWWGTTDAAAISRSIYDFKDDFNLGTVNFAPFLTEPNLASPPIPEIDTLTPQQTPTSTPTLTPSESQTTTTDSTANPTPTTAASPTPPTSEENPSTPPSASFNPTLPADQSGNQTTPGTELSTIVIAALAITVAVLAVGMVVLYKKKR